MRRAFPKLLAAGLGLALASCGEPVRDDHFANEAVAPRAEAPDPVEHVVPVRVGELGPSFAACASAGTTRHLKAGERLPVRAAWFDSAAETGGIVAGQRFFVCTRSHNQKWMGVVYDESGTLSERCAVSSPATARRNYEGPCSSGWVQSAFVRSISGVEQPVQENQAPPAEAQKGG